MRRSGLENQMTKFTAFDSAKYLGTEEAIAAYLEAAAEGGDAKHFAQALGTVARARNFAGLAKKIGVTRAGLYRALSEEGNPSLRTTMGVLASLGLELTVKRQRARKKKAPAP